MWKERAFGQNGKSKGQLIGDADFYRCANVLIKQHGEDAAMFVAMDADKLLEDGDMKGFAVWKRILRAIRALGEKVPPAAGTVH